MICKKCGKEYSQSVYPLHVKRCINKQEDKKDSKDYEIRQEAKKLNIKSWHLKNIDNLIDEIKKMEMI